MYTLYKKLFENKFEAQECQSLEHERTVCLFVCFVSILEIKQSSNRHLIYHERAVPFHI